VTVTPEQLEFVQQAFRRIPDVAPLAPHEVELALEHHRQAVIAVARMSDVYEPLLPIYRSIRLHTSLNSLKLPVDYPVACAVLERNGVDAVRLAVTDARTHPAAREILRGWIKEASNAADDSLPTDPDATPAPAASASAPASSARAPIHDTPLPPPGASRPSQPAPARSMAPNGAGQGTAPIGRRPDQAPRPPQNNVAHLPTRADARSAARHMDDDQPRNDFDDDRADDRPMGRQQTDASGNRVWNDDKAEVFTKGGRGAGLRFSNSYDDRKEKGRHVVFVELAPIAADGRSYQWKDRKITIMLNDSEVEQVILVLLGLMQIARFSAHGNDKKKWFQVQNQPEGNFQGRVQVQAGDGDTKNNILVNIFPQDVTRVTAVLLRGYKAMRNVSEEFAVMMLRSAARNYTLAAAVAPTSGSGGGGGAGGGGQGAYGGRSEGARQYSSARG
jgi:hypothetical protein